MQSLLVVGAGGHAREVLSLIGRINDRSPSWVVKGLLVDPQYQLGEELDGVPILGGLESLITHPDAHAVIAVGSSEGRSQIADRLSLMGSVQFATLVDPDASVASNATVAPGSQVLSGAVIGAAAEIGRHCIINYGAIVSHECRIADFVTIGPAACLGGRTSLLEGVEVGIGARLLPRLKVEAGAAVGAGAVVTRSVAADSTVVGVPARALKPRGAPDSDQGEGE
jgi:sugar O-acyltransferase (sialic acid O-acetyltransferase NeuD family)